MLHRSSREHQTETGKSLGIAPALVWSEKHVPHRAHSIAVGKGANS
jgi:hypothetical protein